MSQLGPFGLLETDLSTRLKLVNILPSAILLVTTGALLISGAPSKEPSWATMHRNAVSYGWPGAAIASVGSLIMGLVLQPFELASIRFMEGYWSSRGPLRSLAELGSWLHDRRRRRLVWLKTSLSNAPPTQEVVSNLADIAKELQLLPARLPMLPTKLGNRLRAAEERAGWPYDIDAIELWPRLYHALPPEALRKVSDHRTSLDTAVRLCISFAATAVISTVLLAEHGKWLVLPGILAVLSWIAHRASINAAIGYGTAFTAVIDVYRLRLLREMWVKVPADSDAERSINNRIHSLWRREEPEAYPAEPLPFDPKGDGSGAT